MKLTGILHVSQIKRRELFEPTNGVAESVKCYFEQTEWATDRQGGGKVVLYITKAECIGALSVGGNYRITIEPVDDD